MVFQLRRGGKSTCCATAPGEISTIGLRHPPAKVKDAGEAKCPGLCGKPDELSQSHIKSVSCRRADYIPPGPACQPLVRYQHGQFKTYATRDGLGTNVIKNLFTNADGSLLISTSAGLDILQQEKISPWLPSDKLKTANITATAGDGAGRLRFGTLDGLVEYYNGKTTAHSVSEILANNRISSLCFDREGSLWIGTAGGLSRFRSGQFDTLTTAGGLSSNLITSIFEDREGSMWIGTEAGGVNLLKSKKFMTFTTREGLSSDQPSSLKYCGRTSGSFGARVPQALSLNNR